MKRHILPPVNNFTRFQAADIAFIGRFQLRDWTVEVPDFYTNVMRIIRSPHLDRRVSLGMLLQIDPLVGLEDPTSFSDGYPWDVGLSTATERSGYIAVMNSFQNHRRVGLPIPLPSLATLPIAYRMRMHQHIRVNSLKWI